MKGPYLRALVAAAVLSAFYDRAHGGTMKYVAPGAPTFEYEPEDRMILSDLLQVVRKFFKCAASAERYANLIMYWWSRYQARGAPLQ
uniref:Secreted protein n=1 Tax=Peronospora matthiolae TaxID=2874970 RepID=A0AAV1UH83_9STRA